MYPAVTRNTCIAGGRGAKMPLDDSEYVAMDSHLFCLFLEETLLRSRRLVRDLYSMASVSINKHIIIPGHSDPLQREARGTHWHWNSVGDVSAAPSHYTTPITASRLFRTQGKQHHYPHKKSSLSLSPPQRTTSCVSSYVSPSG